MLGSSRGKGGGGSRQGGSWYDGKMRAYGTDRFCTACGKLIKGLATTMIGKCQHCGESVPMRFGPDEDNFDPSGWGRCINCKSFMNRDHVYCQNCGCVNQVGKNKKERLQRQAMLRRQALLKAENEEKDAKIARLEARNEELNSIVAQQEQSAHLSSGGNGRASHGMAGTDAFQDDGLDDILSQLGDTDEICTGDGTNGGKEGDQIIVADVTKE